MDPDLAFVLYKLVLVLFAAWALAGRSLSARGLPPVLIAGVTVLVPLTLAVVFGDERNTDIDNFQYTARLLRDGDDVYTAPWPSLLFPFHPYFPLHMYVLALMDIAAGLTHVPFAVLVKTPTIAAVGGIAYLVHRMARRPDGDEQAPWLAGLVALNPIVVWVVAMHGQFDAIPALLLLTALYVRPGSGGSLVVSALLLGAAIAYKTWPLLAAPAILASIPGTGARIRFTTIAAGVIALVVTFYSVALWTMPDDMLRTIREYHGIPGLTGYTRVLFELPGSDADVRWRRDLVLDHGTQLLTLALVATCLVTLSATATMRAITTMILAFYAFTPGGADQYYVWIMPFALLGGQAGWLIAFSLLAGTGDCPVLYCESDQFFWPLPGAVASHAWIPGAFVWLFIVGWLGWNVSESLRERLGAARAPVMPA